MNRCLIPRHTSTAALCAGVLAAHLWLGLAGTAFAQSATEPEGTQETETAAMPEPDVATDSNTDPDPDAVESSQDDTEELPDKKPEQDEDARAPRTSALDRLASDPSDILDSEALQELRRQNMREAGVDGLETNERKDRSDSPGVRVGSFILRPSLTETIGSERTTTGDQSSTRSYLRSGLRASLTSDWSLHELRIDAEGTWDKTLSGVREDDPEGSIKAELKLELSDETTATLRAGYSLKREDVSDPNAVANAVTQSDVEEYTAGAEVTRDLGLIRATAGLDFTRETYSDAILSDGQFLDQSERNNNMGTLRGRLGYELSPALIPFLEASYGRVIYDQHRDSLSYVRDTDIYATKAGVEVDLGEKLKGELAGGYLIANFDDAALRSITAATIDGNAVWSPYRGTDLAFNLRTDLEPSTTAGASGSVAYVGTVVLSQVILENITGQISSGLTLRDYSQEGTPVQSVLALGTGLTWGISRSLDINADIAWEKTQQQGIDSTEVLRAGIGLTLKR